MTLDFKQVGDGASLIYDSFVLYVNALHKCITSQLPDVIETADRLPDDAERARNHAEHEFDSLGVMKKAQAVLATATNLKKVPQIPTQIKQSA